MYAWAMDRDTLIEQLNGWIIGPRPKRWRKQWTEAFSALDHSDRITVWAATTSHGVDRAKEMKRVWTHLWPHLLECFAKECS